MSRCDGLYRGRRTQPPVSIIIPTLNEEKCIETTLNHLHQACPGGELIVVDGGSTDSTTTIAAKRATVFHAPRGRALQMNRGAQVASASVLWFIHADCWIDPDAFNQLQEALRVSDVVGGGLTLKFDRHTPALDYLAWSSTKRAQYLHQIFGDQTLFVRRSTFERLGGFPELPIMEDLEFSRRLARQGQLVVLPSVSVASSRRFLEHGTWSMIAFMQLLKASYLIGVQPTSIERWYQHGPFWNSTNFKPSWNQVIEKLERKVKHPKEPLRPQRPHRDGFLHGDYDDRHPTNLKPTSTRRGS